jgi:Fe-S-cluster containining protein
MTPIESDAISRNEQYDRIQIAERECYTAIESLKGGSSAARVLKLSRKAIDRADRLVEAVKQKEPPHRPIACEKGCSFCCRMFRTYVVALEVIAVAAFLKETMSDRQMAVLKARIAELDDQTRRMDMKQRAYSRLACALLVEDRCCVYPVRPLRCRAYNAFGVDRCRLLYETGNIQTGVDGYLPQREIPFLVQTGLRAAIDSCGYDSSVLDLTTALRFALQSRDIAEEWLRDEPVFAPARVEEER